MSFAFPRPRAVAEERIWPGLGGIYDMARSALESHGYDVNEHSDVAAALEEAFGEAILDTITKVFREHGLKRENEYATEPDAPTEETGGDGS